MFPHLDTWAKDNKIESDLLTRFSVQMNSTAPGQCEPAEWAPRSIWNVLSIWQRYRSRLRPSADGIEKARANNQVPTVYCIQRGAKVPPIRRCMRKQITAKCPVAAAIRQKAFKNGSTSRNLSISHGTNQVWQNVYQKTGSSCWSGP